MDTSENGHKMVDMMEEAGCFWLHSDCSLAFKIRVYDAVVKSKLLYVLESLQFTYAQIRMLETLQLRGS
eukprot:12934166-Prorocentrum_lima.AAC.1